MAASIPIAQPSLRQRAKTELIILPKANKRGSAPAFLQAMQLPMSQPSSKGSSHLPLSNQVSLSLFGDTAEETEEVRQRSEPRLPRPRSPGDSRRRLEKTCPEEDSLNLPIMAQMLIDRERAEKHKLQAEAKEQVRLHDFDKIMMMSQFQEERDVMRDQKEQLVAKLRNSHMYGVCTPAPMSCVMCVYFGVLFLLKLGCCEAEEKKYNSGLQSLVLKHNSMCVVLCLQNKVARCVSRVKHL
eukprot:GEMP01091600.1.p1 GENE.GEMP01091600.1~~GEMP01091600.1.p1  ORF type:complete len:241 (+),score=42.42 GEMP01091600.1:135-857(+)